MELNSDGMEHLHRKQLQLQQKSSWIGDPDIGHAWGKLSKDVSWASESLDGHCVLPIPCFNVLICNFEVPKYIWNLPAFARNV